MGQAVKHAVRLLNLPASSVELRPYVPDGCNNSSDEFSYSPAVLSLSRRTLSGH